MTDSVITITFSKRRPTIRYPYGTYGKGRKNGLELVTYTSKFKILLGFVANYIV